MNGETEGPSPKEMGLGPEDLKLGNEVGREAGPVVNKGVEGTRGRILETLKRLPKTVIAFHGTEASNIDSIRREGLVKGGSSYFVVEPETITEGNLSEAIGQFHNSVKYATGKGIVFRKADLEEAATWENLIRNKNLVPAVAVFVNKNGGQLPDKSYPHLGQRVPGYKPEHLRYGNVTREGPWSKEDWEMSGVLELSEDDVEKLNFYTFSPQIERKIAKRALSRGDDPEAAVGRFRGEPLSELSPPQAIEIVQKVMVSKALHFIGDMAKGTER